MLPILGYAAEIPTGYYTYGNANGANGIYSSPATACKAALGPTGLYPEGGVPSGDTCRRGSAYTFLYEVTCPIGTKLDPSFSPKNCVLNLEPEEPPVSCNAGDWKEIQTQIGVFDGNNFTEGKVVTRNGCLSGSSDGKTPSSTQGCGFEFVGWDSEVYGVDFKDGKGVRAYQNALYRATGDSCTPTGEKLSEYQGTSQEGDGEGEGDSNSENNACPPGYAQGPNTTTCFKIPKEEDYKQPDDINDPGNSADPNNPTDPNNPGGTGTGNESGEGTGSNTVGTGTGGTGSSGTGNTGGGKDGEAEGEDKDGDGEEEKEGEDDEEDESEFGGGDSCESPPSCSGDAIQCGIAQQSWLMRCAYEESNNFPAQQVEIEGLVTGPQFELLEAENEIEVPSFLDNHARWLGSACPPEEVFNLRLGGGKTFALSYQPLCQAATTISPLIIIIATVMATLYIGRSA